MKLIFVLSCRVLRSSGRPLDENNPNICGRCSPFQNHWHWILFVLLRDISSDFGGVMINISLHILSLLIALHRSTRRRSKATSKVRNTENNPPPSYAEARAVSGLSVKSGLKFPDLHLFGPQMQSVIVEESLLFSNKFETRAAQHLSR